MLNIFNRCELISTFKLEHLSFVRAILNLHGIAYYIKTIHHRSSSPFPAGGRGHTGEAFEKSEYSYHYILYVHKNDYKRAKELIR